MYKRYEHRRLAAVPIELITPATDLPFEFVTWDISPRGAFVMSDAKPKLGEQIVCSFSLTGKADEYCFFGEVVRVDPKRRAADRGPRGFSVRFIDATPRERMKLRRLLRNQPPSLPAPKRNNSLTRAMGWS